MGRSKNYNAEEINKKLRESELIIIIFPTFNNKYIF